jgi:hypothetical protein
MDKDPWASTELAEAPSGWIRAMENGWGALAVWAAGHGNFVRVPAAAGDRYGMAVHRLPDGSERSEPFVLTQADLESIDDDIDSYLADAGLPPRPRGYDWFIRRPPNTQAGEDAFWSALWAAATATLPGGGVRPAAIKGLAKEALARMYQGQG